MINEEMVVGVKANPHNLCSPLQRILNEFFKKVFIKYFMNKQFR